jgi:activator of HSP90 ATPase
VKDLKGESSVSIRKQKKIVTYEYSTKLLWKCDMGDESNSKVVGSISGEYFMPEISNDMLDDEEEWEVNCSIKEGDETLVKTLY